MPRQIKYIVWHCSATKDNQDIGAETIRDWHINYRGWLDIGYALVVRRDGSVELGRDLDNDGDIFEEIGAHTLGYNKESIGLCWVGGYGGVDNRTEAQKRTMESITKMLHTWYPNAEIKGHRDFENVNKDCPSFDVGKWLEEIKLKN